MAATAQRTEAAGTGSPPPGQPGQGGLGRRLSDFVEQRVTAVFMAPAVVFVAVMMVFPVLYTVYVSLHEWSGGSATPDQFIGLDNFGTVLGDGRFWAAFWRTAVFTVAALAVQTVLGVGIAVLYNREFMGKGLIRTLSLFPMMATPVAIALVWRLMYEPNNGIINELLSSVGLPTSQWVADPGIALWALAVVDTWQWTPLITLIVLAGLSALSTDPYEAAAIDGANAWQTFWRITLPMLRPVIIVAATFRLIDALKTFDIIYVITQGGPAFATETLNLYVYAQSFQYQNLGYASSLLIVFFAIVVAASVLLLRFRRAPS